MVESIRCLKKASLDLLSQEDAAEAAPYFDYIIQAAGSESALLPTLRRTHEQASQLIFSLRLH